MAITDKFQSKELLLAALEKMIIEADGGFVIGEAIELAAKVDEKDKLRKENLSAKIEIEKQLKEIQKHLEATSDELEIVKKQNPANNDEVQKQLLEAKKILRERDEIATKYAESSEKLTGLQKEIERSKILDAVRGGIEKANLAPSVVKDAELFANMFMTDQSGTIVTKDGQTPDKFFVDYAKERPHLLPGSQGTGASPGTSGQPQTAYESRADATFWVIY